MLIAANLIAPNKQRFSMGGRICSNTDLHSTFPTIQYNTKASKTAIRNDRIRVGCWFIATIPFFTFYGS